MPFKSSIGIKTSESAHVELLEQGGPALWQEFMDELRHFTLVTGRSRSSVGGTPPPAQLRRCVDVIARYAL
jgi:hypothetical protein